MNNAFNIPQRVLILGATSDIATATAVALTGAGTREFILAARRPRILDRLAGRLHELGATSIELLPFDATELTAHASLVDDVWDRHGHIDLALVAFGTLGRSGVTRCDDDHVDTATSVALVNYVAAVSIIEAMVPRLRAQGTGTLAVLSSVAAERPRADNYVYASSKAGLDSYARGLGDALAPDVHVMVVRPGFVHTKMTAGEVPAPFSVAPEQVAADIVAGVRKRSPIVWSPPIVRGVMSGLRHLPTPIHRRVTHVTVRPAEPEAV